MIRYFLFLILLPITTYSQSLQFGPVKNASSHLQSLDEVGLIINNEAISRKQLAHELQMAQHHSPKTGLESTGDQDNLLLERVIMQHLLKQMSQRAGIAVKTQDIDSAIERMATQNGFSKAQMLQHIKEETGMNENQYRRALSDEIAHQQLKEYYVGSNIHISKAQINDQLAQIARQQGNTIHLQDLLLPVPAVAVEKRGEIIANMQTQISSALKAKGGDLSQVEKEVTSAKFADLGNINIAQMPLLFANAVIDLKNGEMVDKPVIDADGMHFLKVVSKSNEGSDGYVVPEAKMAHILIRHDKQKRQKAKIVIDEIYTELQQGVDFAILAEKYSQDPQSALRGGELGWLSADTVDPRFAEQLKNAPLNQITAPFESAFGWHILKVYKRRLHDRSDEIIRERIRDSLYQSALEAAWQQRLITERQNAYVDIR